MIVLAYDHRGFALGQEIKSYLAKSSIGFEDVSNPTLDENDDAVKFARLGNDYVLKGYIGIYICGTGLAMSMASNRCKGIRGALCINEEFASLARSHNNANVLIIPGNFVKFDEAKKMIDVFLNTLPLGGKYAKRNSMLDE